TGAAAIAALLWADRFLGAWVGPEMAHQGTFFLRVFAIGFWLVSVGSVDGGCACHNDLSVCRNCSGHRIGGRRLSQLCWSWPDDSLAKDFKVSGRKVCLANRFADCRDGCARLGHDIHLETYSERSSARNGCSASDCRCSRVVGNLPVVRKRRAPHDSESPHVLCRSYFMSNSAERSQPQVWDSVWRETQLTPI